MPKHGIAPVAASLFCVSLASVAIADEAAEKYIDDALPLMYHSCASVVDESDGDNGYIENVVRALLAVSLYNREIDVSRYASTDAEKTVLRDKFVEALGRGCKEDNDALLAGVIDDAVVQALSLKSSTP